MLFESTTISLKDGRTCTLRPPRGEDAENMLHYLIASCSQTPFLLRTPEEWAGTSIEDEAKYLEHVAASPDNMMIVAEVDGHLAGNCQINFNHRAKIYHRATIGIALLRDYWSQGIGTAMFRMMEQAARNRGGVRQMELDYVEGNARARGLYEKMGFRIVSMHPNALCQADGSYANSYLMVKEL